MAYQPYLIAGFKTAKSISMEPWLSPEDGFETLENLLINKGVLEKRLGFSELGQMKHGAVAQTTSVITGIHSYEKDGTPMQLTSAGDFALTNVGDIIRLIYLQGTWFEVSESTNQ